MESDIPIQLQVVQEIQAHSSSGQSVQLGQPRYVESPSGQEEPSQAEWGLSLAIDTDFLKSPICHIKIAEFVVLLGAWTTIMKFSKDLQQEYRYDPPDEKEADIFKFITVFCWVMVILYLAFNTISVPKICACRRPSLFSLISLIFNFIMFGLLLACTGNLVQWTDLWGQWLQRYVDEIEPKASRKQGNAFRSILVSLGVASALGVLSCVFFVVDMVLNYKLFQTQRAQETPPDQGPPQRRVWDVNISFVRSPLFYVKMAEFVSLFVAWACIIKYKNTALEIEDYKPEPENEWLFLKTGFFEDVTISSWVMVILLALTSLLSFDKLFSRSSSWTLTILFISLILFMLMIASCGYLTFWAVKLESQFTSPAKVYRSRNFLYTGLGFGFLACLLFIVDMVLDCKMYQTQQAQETPPDQEPPRRRAGDVNKNYLRCPVFYVKLAEISSLFLTWVGILMYLYYFDQWEYIFPGSKAVFFRGVTIFSWAMVIFLTLTSVFSFDKICKRSSSWTLMKLIIYFTLTILLIASCGSLTPQTIFWGKNMTADDKKTKSYILALVIALACGFLSCVLFVVDMVLNYKMYQTQRAQETPPDQRAPQRQGGDVNTKYLRSSVFYVKLAEIVFLLVAWVCIVNYFYFFSFEHMWDVYFPDKDLKADIFKGITVFCWAMVNILTLTSVFSFDKLCSRSSGWTLTTLIIYLILSILLIACCGNLTPRALDLGEYYASLSRKEYEGWSAISLVIGVAFGYLSWLIFIVDIFLLFKLYRKQRTEEVRRPRQAEQVDQPLVTRQPLVVTDCRAKLDFATYV